MRTPWILLPITVLIGAAAPTQGSVPQGPVSPALQSLLESDRHPDLHWSDISDVQADLTRMYAERDWAPLWLSADTLTRPARAMIEVLSEAANRGLNPTDYDAAWLATQAVRHEPTDSALAARIDLGL